MGHLSQLAKEYKGSGFQLLGFIADVNVLDAKGITEAQGVMDSCNANHTTIVSNGRDTAGFMSGVSVVPTTKFYDSNGKLITTIRGAKSKQGWINIIETVMNEKA